MYHMGRAVWPNRHFRLCDVCIFDRILTCCFLVTVSPVRRVGIKQVCRYQLRMKKIIIYMLRIKKIYTCWGRTRNGDELARFESFSWVFFRKSRLSWLLFFRTHPRKTMRDLIKYHNNTRKQWGISCTCAETPGFSSAIPRMRPSRTQCLSLHQDKWQHGYSLNDRQCNDAPKCQLWTLSDSSVFARHTLQKCAAPHVPWARLLEEQSYQKAHPSEKEFET